MTDVQDIGQDTKQDRDARARAAFEASRRADVKAVVARMGEAVNAALDSPNVVRRHEALDALWRGATLLEKACLRELMLAMLAERGR